MYGNQYVEGKRMRGETWTLPLLDFESDVLILGYLGKKENVKKVVLDVLEVAPKAWKRQENSSAIQTNFSEFKENQFLSFLTLSIRLSHNLFFNAH